jgi:hypothetical protein
MTDLYKGVRREMHAAVLYNRDRRFAGLLLDALRRETGLIIADNQPYFVSDATDYTIPRHAEARGLPHVEIEIRQDLVTSAPGRPSGRGASPPRCARAERAFFARAARTHAIRTSPKGAAEHGSQRGFKASQTALATALMRAIHTRLDRNPLIDDPWGERIVPSSVRSDFAMRRSRGWTPGPSRGARRAGSILDTSLRASPAYAGVIMRSRYAEDALRAAVAGGVRQYVLDRRGVRQLCAAPAGICAGPRDLRDRSSGDAGS